MDASTHAQSLKDFGENAAATLARLNETGEAEILTVDGEACAVLLSPAAYVAMARNLDSSRDAAAIGRSMQQHRDGLSVDADVFFDELRSALLATRAGRAS